MTLSALIAATQGNLVATLSSSASTESAALAGDRYVGDAAREEIGGSAAERGQLRYVVRTPRHGDRVEFRHS